ncbi:hypothetical protein J6590_069354 [Homalodisca vitripennis]|nr:hypothetical protein J6590_069354 [Homalodisca vitripennis]
MVSLIQPLQSSRQEPAVPHVQGAPLTPTDLLRSRLDLLNFEFSSDFTHGIWSHVRLKRSNKVDDEEAQNERSDIETIGQRNFLKFIFVDHHPPNCGVVNVPDIVSSI